MIERKKYLERLIARKENGLVKVITGIRRCGKSYLLFNIYKSYLKSIGVEDEQIICLALDDDENIQYRNPLELGKYIRGLTTDASKTYYVFLDEIQKVVTIQNPYIQGVEDKIGFVDVVLGLMKHAAMRSGSIPCLLRSFTTPTRATSGTLGRSIILTAACPS